MMKGGNVEFAVVVCIGVLETESVVV